MFTHVRHCIEEWEMALAARVHESLLPKPVRHPRIDCVLQRVSLVREAPQRDDTTLLVAELK